MRRSIALTLVVTLAVATGEPSAQPPAPTPIVLLSEHGRRTLPVASIMNGEYVSLDDLAAAFGLTVRDDRVTGATSVALGKRTAVLTAERNVVSVDGRLVSLAAPPLRQDGRLVVTPEFVTRALALVLDRRAEFRRASRLLVVGDVRVPRVIARGEYTPNAAQLIFEIAPATDTTVNLSAGQLTVTFAADAVDAALPAVPPQGLVQGLRTGDGAATIVVALGPRGATHRSSVQPVDAGTTRLVIDILAPGAEVPTAGPGAPPPSTPAPPPFVPPLIDPAELGVRTVVIDPGHGGDQPGTSGPSGALEKDVTLQVSRRLKALIESRLGLRVILTRDDDRTLDQDARAAVANNNRADLFVSIHANASVRSSVRGAEVYYLNADRASLESRRAIQQPETSLPQLGGGMRSIELILWETAQLRHLEQSALLAALIESTLRTRVDMRPRPVQQAPFRVLVGANMPAVLVEIGYLSNQEEERALLSAARQDAIALSLFEAISAFRGKFDRTAP